MLRGRAEGLAQGHAAGLAEWLERGREAGLAEGISQGREEGLAEGAAQGEERLSRLLVALIADGRGDEINRAALDAGRREEPYRMYGID